MDWALNCVLNDDDFKYESLDGVCFFDFLEHIENDKDFLNLMHKKLKKGKNIFLAVPSFHALWSREDEYLKHFRRYNINQITKLVENAGCKVIFSASFFTHIIYRGLGRKFGLIKKTGAKTKEEADKITYKEFITKGCLVGIVVGIMCKQELKWLKTFKLPFGSSIILVAKNNPFLSSDKI